MAKPTAEEIRTFLDGYGIDKVQLSDAWIDARRDGFVIPYVQDITRQQFSGIATVTEYYSGANKNVLILNRKPIVEVTNIEYVLGGNYFTALNLGNIEVVHQQGILKAKSNYEEAYYMPLFSKGEYNLKVTYTYGYADYPADIKEAVIYLCSEQILGFIGARTGGGELSGQTFSRSYGDRGKWQDIRNDLSRQAHSIMGKYMTSVVGS